MSEVNLWSAMSPQEFLDDAQEALDEHNYKRANVLLAAAQVQATLSLGWTMENRLGPTMSTAIWEGMRR